MHFQQPNFLWGLLLLFLPLIIHLFQFRKFQVLNFPGVHRLREQLSVAKQTKTIKHWYLLASRVLAFLFLILAFSMPTCNRTQNVATGNQKIIIVLDCSPSMSLKLDAQILIEQARIAARKIVNNANANSEFAIIANHNQTKQQWVDARKAADLISDAQISEFPENFEIWNRDLDALLSAQQSNSCSVYVITDNQLDIYEGHKTIEYPKAQFSIIELESPSVVNLSIDTAYFENPILAQNSNRNLLVRVHASEEQYKGNTIVQLLSGDKLVGSQNVEFIDESEKIVKFQVAESLHGTLKLQLEDQGLLSDNTLYLHQTMQDFCKLNVNGNNVFFNKLIQTQSIFVSQNIKDLKTIDPSIKSLLLCECERINKQDFQLLDQMASDGKNIVCVPQYNGANFGDLFGIKGNWKAQKMNLSPNGFLNDVFKGIFTNEIDQKTQFPFIESYLQIEKLLNQDWQVFLNLENGNPILIQKDYGQGAIWLWLSDLNKGSLAFAKSSWFLPVFTQVLLGKSIDSKPLCGFINAKIPMVFSSTIPFSVEKGGVLKNANGEWVVTFETADQNIGLNTNIPVKKSGFYQMYPFEKSTDKIEIALNSLRSEKDLLHATTDLKNEMQNLGVRFVKNSSLQSKLMMVQSDQGLWKLFLWISVLFFAIEFILLYLKNNIKTIRIK